MTTKDVKIIAVSQEFIPTYETPVAAGADLRACIDEPFTLAPGERKLVDTGIKLELPEGYEAQVRPRSGLANKYGISVVNTPGTIDGDYRGKVMVNLINNGYLPWTCEPGERIAQIVIAPYIQGNFIQVDELSETERGEGGHGSTGTK